MRHSNEAPFASATSNISFGERRSPDLLSVPHFGCELPCGACDWRPAPHARIPQAVRCTLWLPINREVRAWTDESQHWHPPWWLAVVWGWRLLPRPDPYHRIRGAQAIPWCTRATTCRRDQGLRTNGT